MRKRDIGQALDDLEQDIIEFVLRLVAQYRDQAGEPWRNQLMKQALDIPHLVKAQIQHWQSTYDATHGAGAAVTFLTECLAAAGSTKTLGQINAEVAALESQAQTVVNNVNGGWTFDQAADAVEAAISLDSNAEFHLRRLPIPPGYITVWGDPW